MHVRVLTLNVWNSEGNARRTDLINSSRKEVLDISPARLTEILRRGQRGVLQEHFKG
jgi:hypothetical protein